ncbi:MAG: hypothetical protein GVY29_13300 [Spirochaetes bacterium]|nr:hypothetical protein [Spirochaetota bacterium]
MAVDSARQRELIEVGRLSLQGLYWYLYTPEDPSIDHQEYSNRLVETLEQSELRYAELGHSTLAQMERDRRAFALIGQGLDDTAIELAETGSSLSASNEEEALVADAIYHRSVDELRERNRCSESIVKAFVALQDRQFAVAKEHLDAISQTAIRGRWVEGVLSRENIGDYLAHSMYFPEDFLKHAARGVHAARTVDAWEYLTSFLGNIGAASAAFGNVQQGERLLRAVVAHRMKHRDMILGTQVEFIALGGLLTQLGRHQEAADLLQDAVERVTSPSMQAYRHELQALLFENLKALGRTEAALELLEGLYRSEKAFLDTRGRNRARLTKRSYEAEIHRLRYVDLAAEKRRTDAVLHAILPERIASEVKQYGSSTPERFEDVTVLFTDFVGYTAASAGLSPVQLLSELTEIFSEFDEIVRRHGGSRIKTIGDGYMAACGVPDPVDDHADRMAATALEMIDFLADRRARTGQPWEVRCGLNSGPVIAGIVGRTRYAYDIFGDTVNVASRMESASASSRVNATAETVSRLIGDFQTESRGSIPVKGKGSIPMHFITSRRRSGA